MDIDAAFPSSYLKAADLQGRQPTVTIDRVVIEEVGKDKDRRPCLYFAGKEKGIVLNKTNATNISSSYGRDTEGWIGRPVTLFTVWTDFNGQSVEAIRVRPATVQQPVQQHAPAAPPQQQAPAPAPAAQQAPRFNQPAAFETTGDDIPF